MWGQWTNTAHYSFFVFGFNCVAMEKNEVLINYNMGANKMSWNLDRW